MNLWKMTLWAWIAMVLMNIGQHVTSHMHMYKLWFVFTALWFVSFVTMIVFLVRAVRS